MASLADQVRGQLVRQAGVYGCPPTCLFVNDIFDVARHFDKSERGSI